jgi:hypothetical protein
MHKNQVLDQTLSYENSWLRFIGNNTTTEADDSIITYTVEKRTLKALKPYNIISLDSVSGTAAPVTVNLYSRVDTAENYTLRESIVWSTGADTSWSFQSDSSHQSQYWQLETVGSDDAFIYGLEYWYQHFIEEDE